eukprot:gnl/TRDRNA2_/TRDRNA2_164861_c0_seq1.p2 gnl/TRDRNA2_/TRDRNA2_164861_c0~~gnl/TRDRNA2_/TRDRNA2_164861_c0_seq1.p2  ORF type:complete len:430 (-),score=141.68 gnl/TRDRNA2_/TRDRNA2_164861_c0_seq1:966-2255(-)
MKTFALLAALFIVGAGALKAGGRRASTSRVHPVSKVVKLLEDMQKKLEAEHEADEAAYDKMACWCETNDKAKTKAIADAEQKVADLGDEILQLTETSARLKVEIKALTKDVAHQQKALDAAIKMREKQYEEFVAEEKSTAASVASLADALDVLGKHHGAGAGASASLVAVKNIIRLQLEKDKAGDGTDALLPNERRIVEEFVQDSRDPTKSYNPQSGEIFGILKTMKENFEGNLEQMRNEEATNKSQYDELKAAKEEEIKASQDSLQEKTRTCADTDERLAVAKEDRKDTQIQLNADQKFLSELKVKCTLNDKEWEKRKAMREEEIKAVKEAIELLSSDDARELFGRTFNDEEDDDESFLQKGAVSTGSDANRRTPAARQMWETAMRTRDPARRTVLMQLVARIRIDGFTRVKKSDGGADRRYREGEER